MAEKRTVKFDEPSENSMRQIVLDTETTGLSLDDGHRVIEIGCVELVDRRPTDRRFHIYVNPDREIDQGAIDVHGITNEFLQDKPRFKDIVDDFLAFVSESEIIIHNAPFDVGFLNRELLDAGFSYGKLEDYATVIDTLSVARQKHPGQRNSLDALCKRYNIDNSHRELHGALLDAEILADVYLMMTGGQTSLLTELDEPRDARSPVVRNKKAAQRPKLKVINCDTDEFSMHEGRLAEIEKSSGGKCLWKGKV